METSTVILLVGGAAGVGYLMLRSRGAAAAGAASGGARGGGGGGGGAASAAPPQVTAKRKAGAAAARNSDAPSERQSIGDILKNAPPSHSRQRPSATRPATGGRTTPAMVAQTPKLGATAAAPRAPTAAQARAAKAAEGARAFAVVNAARYKPTGNAVADRSASIQTSNAKAIAAAAVERAANTGAGRF